VAEIGSVLGGRYRLVELLAQGGMATIYRARDAQLERDVAVKVLRPEYGRDPDFLARFRQEAQSAASLAHPNIVAVYDYGHDEQGPFIVMELVDGEDSPRSCGGAARCRHARRRASPARRPGRSPPRTSAGSSTATSSPATFSSPARGRRRSPTSGSRGRSRRRRSPCPGRRSARSTTSAPSRPGARRRSRPRNL
jgi:hypothetical protein